MSNFDTAFAHVFDIEGGFVDDPKDPGGKTNFGITEETLQRAKMIGLVPESVTIHTLTPTQSRTIYLEMYWKTHRCDELPWPLAMFVFDAAVNQGGDPSNSTAIRILQKTLGVAVDGKIGPKTLAAAQRMDAEQIAMYLSDRALRYTGTRNFDRFGRGWFKRLFKLAMSQA